VQKQFTVLKLKLKVPLDVEVQTAFELSTWVLLKHWQLRCQTAYRTSITATGCQCRHIGGCI
jgi:hypothetical protein